MKTIDRAKALAAQSESLSGNGKSFRLIALATLALVEAVVDAIETLADEDA